MQSASDEWMTALAQILSHGKPVNPRGMACREIIGMRTCIDMTQPVMCIEERNLGYRFMAAEAAWILSGDNRVKTIAPYSKAISQFSDDKVTFFGAYGPKIRDQVRYVVAQLIKDPDTRQAVINIWRENPPITKDVPCTLSAQFLIRDNQLHVLDTMRSSDIWLGWPYDVFNFSMLARYVILYIRQLTGKRYQLGNLYLTAGSAHLYATDEDDANDLMIDYHKREHPFVASYEPADVDDFVEWLWEKADVGFFKA